MVERMALHVKSFKAKLLCQNGRRCLEEINSYISMVYPWFILIHQVQDSLYQWRIKKKNHKQVLWPQFSKDRADNLVVLLSLLFLRMEMDFTGNRAEGSDVASVEGSWTRLSESWDTDWDWSRIRAVVKHDSEVEDEWSMWMESSYLTHRRLGDSGIYTEEWWGRWVFLLLIQCWWLVVVQK